MSESVLCQRYSHVARITLNRPERGNAVNIENLTALKELLDEAIGDDDVRAIVLEGRDGVFCRGMDFRFLLEQRSESRSEPEKHGVGELSSSFSAPYLRAVMTLRNSPKPVIAAIDGDVLAGGMGLALACDMVLATRGRSTFGLSEVLFGLIPAYVFPFLLERVTFKRARYLVLSSKKLTAEEALQFGIVDDLADDDALERKLSEHLKRVLYSSPQALALTKSYSDVIARQQIEEAVETAGDQLTALLNDEKNIDAIRSFLEGDKMSWMVRYRRPKGGGATPESEP